MPVNQIAALLLSFKVFFITSNCKFEPLCCGITVSLQANIGQDEDFEEARKKAESLGAKKVRGDEICFGWM